MIGLIGPKDSVRRVEDVAQRSGMVGELLSCPYDDLSEVQRLTVESASACRVLLFTGLVPYLIAKSHGVEARSIYIAHSAADLYAGLARLMLEGVLPRTEGISVDVVSREIVDEVFDDLGATNPTFVLEFSADHSDPSIDDLVDRHAQLYRSGRTSFALTCLDAVSRGLDRAEVPHYRLPHTRASVRESLARSAYLDSMQTAEDGLPAVAVLRLAGMTSRASRSAFGQRFADALNSVIFHISAEDDIVVQTTRGAVEAYAKRMAADFAELDGARPLAGFGFGKTLMRAHSEAHAALSFSGENGLLYSVFEGGVPRMRSTDPRMDASGVNALQQRAAQLRLSPMVLYRISNALKVLDHSAFSAEELAGAYGGSARTARRLISRLREAGVVTQTGSTRSPGAGRPVSMYAADINRLLSVGGADNE